eukprot:2327753-Rhodomonas_salina.1
MAAGAISSTRAATVQVCSDSDGAYGSDRRLQGFAMMTMIRFQSPSFHWHAKAHRRPETCQCTRAEPQPHSALGT